MTITVQLEPELEERLAAQARAHGVSLDSYLRALMEEAAAGESRAGVSLDDFDAGLDALAEGSEHLPVLPPEAYRRETIYGDD